MSATFWVHCSYIERILLALVLPSVKYHAQGCKPSPNFQ
nr:MAG TPA_asm: hypothetical protein [Caudoviricetes sp.]